eukprot:SAG11_NODE_612_length_8206_cov_4.251110_8_plen_91_part_01
MQNTSDTGLKETNFHVRQYLEGAISKGAASVHERIQCEVGWESFMFQEICSRAIVFDRALNMRSHNLFLYQPLACKTRIDAQMCVFFFFFL